MKPSLWLWLVANALGFEVAFGQGGGAGHRVAATKASAAVVARVRRSKTLRCGIDQAMAEYTTLDLHGPRIEFDLELCHAVAVAIAGAEARVLPVFVPDEASAVAALVAAKVDLLPTVSLDFTHGTTPGLLLGPAILIDGTGLLVPSATSSAGGLAGRKVCFFAGTETEDIARSWFRQMNVEPVLYPFSEEGEMEAALLAGNCEAIAGDWTRLAHTREGFGSAAARFKLLPEVLAPDPLGPAATDPDLVRIASWVNEVLLHAALMGVNRANLAAMLKSEDSEVQRLLGRTHELGPRLGLDDAWPVRVLAAVGNYQELRERTLGQTVPATGWPAALPFK